MKLRSILLALALAYAPAALAQTNQGSSPLSPPKGGTGIATYTLGDLLYATNPTTLSRLAGNITTARKFLRQAGTGAVSAAPAWDTILAADIPGSAVTRTNDTNVTLTLGGSASTGALNAFSMTVGWTGTLAGARGGFGTDISASSGVPLFSAGTPTFTSTTGTGNFVRATSPALVTPDLGTPSAGVLTNATGLPIATGVSGLGTGIATFLATPSSANLAAAVTNETGSGALVFATSPTFVTPALGTPASGVLTNATGLPIATGVSGLGTGVATALATPSSANIAAAVTDETGTGALVFATSPTFVTPALGTPASGVLTNATGLPIATGVAGLGTGVATFLGTPSSANLAAALTDETGTGAAVFANGPTFIAPVLGTPASGTLTNATGLPIATGVSGLGTGVATFLATPSSANLAAAVTNETGSGALVFATSPVLVTPDLGTPSAGVLTNATGLPIATGVSGLGTGVAAFLGTPSSANLAAAVTNETGSGALVFGTAPTLSAPVLTGLADMQGVAKLSTQTAPAQITANQNNYNPSSVVCATSETLLLNSDAARDITGIAGGVAGCPLAIINNGSFSITLKEESGSSTAANRFGFGGDLILASKQGALLRYDGGSSRWRMIGGPSSSGGGAGTVTSVAAGDGMSFSTITTSGTVTLDPALRRTALLDRIYLSKALADHRRGVNTLAVGFKGSTDALNAINTGSSSNYTVSAASGTVTPSTSGGTLIPAATGTVIGDLTVNGGNAAAFDGNTSQNGGASAAKGTGTTAYIGKNYSAGSSQVVGTAKVYNSNDRGFHDNGEVTNLYLYGKQTSTTTCNDGTLLGSLLSQSSAANGVQTITSSDTSTAWAYLCIYITHATSGTATYVAEVQFLGPSSINNMTLITTSQTADASVSSGRVLLEYDNTATPTLDTDLTAEVTCNGGTNWASAALTAVTSNSQSGRKVAESADQACTSGTSFAARIKTLNNKSIPIHGLSLTVR